MNTERMSYLNQEMQAEMHRRIEKLEVLLAEAGRREAEQERRLLEEREQRARAETLLQTGAALGSTLNYEEVLDSILEQAQELFPHDASSIVLIEEDRARIFRWRGYTRFGAEGSSVTLAFNLDDMPVLRAIRDTGQPLVIPDVNVDERWSHELGQPWIKSYAGAPILAQDHVIGFLNLNSATPGFFEDLDIRGLTSLSSQAGQALENARLHDQARQEVIRRVRTLKQERNFISTVLDTAGALVIVLNRQGRIVQFNRACEQVTAYSFDEVKGRYWGNLFLPAENATSIKTEIEQLSVGQSPREYQGYWRTKDGQQRLIAWSITAFEMGLVEFILLTGIDVTERNRAEEALRASEERFRQVVSSISDHVYVTRVAQGERPVNLYLSAHVEPLTGYPRERFAADWSFWPSRVIHPDDRTAAAAQADRLARGINSEMEYRLVQANGNIIWVRDSARVEHEEPFKIVYGVVSDITERKHSEQVLTAANRQLQTLTDRLQRELIVARRIQQSLLSTVQPRGANLDLVSYCSPAREVGGDFYAYHTFRPGQEDGRLVVAVGDISGKGMPAALLMAVSLTALQSIISYEAGPADILARLDRMVQPYTTTTRQYCAVCCAALQGDTLWVANAGCVAPLICRADGKIEWADVSGLPLGTGLQEQQPYQEKLFKVGAGDLFIFTSDGLIEATDPAGRLFSFERLEQAVACGPKTSAGAMLAHLREEIATFTRNAESHDDLTIVILQI